MTFVQLLSILAFSVFTVLISGIGAAMEIRRTRSENDRLFLTRFFAVLMITFLAGGITRSIQQDTQSKWLDGFVPMFMGLFVSLWGLPFLWRVEQNRLHGLKKALALLIGLLFILLALGLIYLGVVQSSAVSP